MKNLDSSAESFQIKFEKFLIGCEAVEKATLWDANTYGGMPDFYAGLLVSIILRTITADGWISDREVEYLDALFGFEYESNELEQVYESCSEMLRSTDFEKDLSDGIALLRENNVRLADAFVELTVLVCDIIVRSDGFVTDEEKEEVCKIRAMIA